MPSSAGDAIAWLGSLLTVVVALVAVVILTAVAISRLRRPRAAPPAVPMLTP
jgi:hypothetical protein